MAFMLGSFTSGLFGGAADMTNIMNSWEKLKQNRMETQRQKDLMDAGSQVKQALDTTSDQAPATGPVTSTGSATSSAGSGGWTKPDIESMPLPKFMQPNSRFRSASPISTTPAAGAMPSAASASAPIPPATGSTDSSSPNEGQPFGSADVGQARAAWNQYLALSPADRYRMQREGQSAPPNPDAATAADAYRAVREGRGAISPREQDIFGAAPATQGIPTGPSTAPPQYLPGQNSALRLVRESAAPATQGGPTGTPVGAMAPIPPGASAPIPPAPGSSAQLAPPQTPPGRRRWRTGYPGMAR